MVAVRVLFVAVRNHAECESIDAHFERYDLEFQAQSYRDANQRIRDHVRRVVRAEAMRIVTQRASVNIAPFDPQRGDRPWTQLFVHNDELRESMLLSEHAWACVQAVLAFSPFFERKVVVRVDLDTNSEAETRRLMLALGNARSPLLSRLPVELLQRVVRMAV